MVKEELESGVYRYGDLVIDTKKGMVKIGGSIVCETLHDTRLFYQAYDMGREHKKMQIRKALSI